MTILDNKNYGSNNIDINKQIGFSDDAESKHSVNINI